MTTARKEWEIDQLFEELTQIFGETSENLKPKKVDEILPDRKKEIKKDVKPVAPANTSTYKRSTGPRVLSIEEYQRRVANGEFKNVVSTPREIPTVKKEEKTTIKKPKVEKIVKVEKDSKHKRKIAKMSKIIQRNVAHELRFTESKKRNLLSRIILQERLAKGRFRDLEQDIDAGYVTQEDVNASKVADKWYDRRLFKEVQAYEDAKEDVSVRKGWNTFKLSLAGVALAGAIALSAYTYNEVNNFFEELGTKNKIVSIADIKEDERIVVETEAQKVRREIIEKDGYHFNNISEDEFFDGYYRMLAYEKKLDERRIENTIHGIIEDKDQQLLETIVSECFKGEYETFTEEQKRDYKQLAFELLSYSHPEKTYYIRNPIVMDELRVKNDLKERGYKIELRVNGDEVETVRNLGNIRNEIQELTEVDYNSYKDSQEEFFEDILQSVMGENLESLGNKAKRDYIQIIYEWLPEVGKKYIQDPIEIEKASQVDNNQINGMEIGD